MKHIIRVEFEGVTHTVWSPGEVAHLCALLLLAVACIDRQRAK